MNGEHLTEKKLGTLDTLLPLGQSKRSKA